MKKIIFFILVILIIASNSLYANKTNYICFGVTNAKLQFEDGRSKFGKFIGLGIENKIYKPVYFGIEAAYTSKKITLENKTWPNSIEVIYADVEIADIDIMYTFLEFTLKIGYRYPVLRNSCSVKFFLGPSYSAKMKYIGHTKDHERTIILDQEEKGKYKFDYYRVDLSSVSSLNYIIGSAFSYKLIDIEFRYEKGLTKTPGIWGLNIQDKIDCLYMLFRMNF